MKIKHLTLLGAITLSTISFAAYADLSITNNTKTGATASAASSPCSGSIGSKGVIAPGGHVEIPDWAVGVYCRTNCTAHVYMSKNCSGKSIATVTANMKDGVVDVINNGVDGYHVEGRGKVMTIEGGPSRKWYELFF